MTKSGRNQSRVEFIPRGSNQFDAANLRVWRADVAGSNCRTAPAGRCRPRGAVLVIVLVALLVAFAVLVSIVRLAAAERQAWRTQTWQTQAAWLAESGLERAAARLHDDPKYQGETWIVPAEVFGGRWSGKVTIQVATLADQPAQRQIRVQADYPDDPQDRARRTRDAVLRIPQ